MKRPSAFYFFLLIFLLTACINKMQAPAPVTLYGTSEGAGSAGVHSVIGNETLWSISQRYKLGMRDIATANNLAPPFDLKPGQRLLLPPPREYHVREGDDLHKVSKFFSVNNSEIARLNNLQAPYKLSAGQVLRLPMLTRKTQAVVIASAERMDGGVVAGRSPLYPPASGGKEIESTSGVIAGAPEAVVAEPLLPPEPQAMQVVAVAPEAPEPKTPVTAQVPKRSSSKFLTPVSGKVISGYGPKKNGLHNDGINIAAAKGTPVHAAENGVVVYAGNELKGSGNLIIVRHQDRWMTAYAHMDNLKIKRGDTVKRGQTIGTVGSTGSVDAPQLHFEVRRGTEAINPKMFLEG